MLTNNQLLQLYERLDLSPAAQGVIEQIRASPPVRRVRSGAGNVCVRYPSRKMGVIIQAESHKNELAGVYEKEYDPAVLAYYDQPNQIDLVYQAKSGRSVKVRHTPDFFVIRQDAIGWEEWKTEPELLRLTERMPHRYVRTETGAWRCPPGEAYAQPLGFFYQVRSSAEIEWVYQRNLRFLEDYLADDYPEIKPAVKADIEALVQQRPGLLLDELLSQMGHRRSDPIYRLIATGQIYCDLRRVPLAEPKQVPVYSDAETAHAYGLVAETLDSDPMPTPHLVRVAIGETVLWDNRPWQITNLGENKTWLQSGEGTLIELSHQVLEGLVKQGQMRGSAVKMAGGLSEKAREVLQGAAPEDLQEANRRYQIIAPALRGEPVTDQTTPARTRRRWLARYRQGEQEWRCGYLGLIPQRAKRGNRQPKLPPETETLLEEFIVEQYETLKQKSKRIVYGQLLLACQAQEVAAPSYVTFSQRIDQRPAYDQVKSRQGHRAAYQHQVFYHELHLTTPRHGDRPFEIGHIDHTQLDLELICAHTGRNLGRPWVTFLVDAFSRRLLALHLTYDAPSYRSCMMILREVVRRHARLPQVVVVDGGADFESTYFETLLARYECSKKTRPGAQPRFGSVCERLFGTANTTFIHNLLGNTQAMGQVRQVTKEVNPRYQAQWTLERLYVRLCEWAYQIYDTLDHPALGQSPRAAFVQGTLQSGLRTHRLIPYDDDFRMFTLPTTPKGTAKVLPNLGVKINRIYYWADAFGDPQVEQSQVPVRYDPFNMGVAYAFTKGRWVRCVSEYYASFRGRSERELKLAAAELGQKKRAHEGRFALTARQLAAFLDSVEAEETLLEQRLRDAEGQQVLSLAQAEQPLEKGLTGGERGAEPNQPANKQPRSPQTASAQPARESETLTIYEDF